MLELRIIYEVYKLRNLRYAAIETLQKNLKNNFKQMNARHSVEYFNYY